MDDPEIKFKKIHLLSFDGCPGCASAKEDLSEEIEKGIIVETRVDSDDGVKILNALGISSIPQLVIETIDGEYCLINENGEPGDCIKPEEKEE